MRSEPVVNGLELITFMGEHGYDEDVAHDMIFYDLYPPYIDRHKNDTYWHMCRFWCQTDEARAFWDAVFVALELPNPETSWLVIWMSW